MNIRLNWVLGFVALVLLGWFYTQNYDNESLDELIKKPESPEYTGHKMETVMYSLTGDKQYIARSEKIEYFNYDGHTDFENPVVLVLDVPLALNKESKKNLSDTESAVDNQKESWQLKATQAKLTKDNLLYLTGNVVAQALMPESRLQRIETESAVVNLNTQDITSDAQVKIRGQNFTSTGLKLTGNLKQQVATLKEQVKTYYEVNNQNSQP